jgi:fatty-acyl-CoA synthase
MRAHGSTVNASALTADGCFADPAAEATAPATHSKFQIMIARGDGSLHRVQFTPDLIVRALNRDLDRTVIRLMDGTTINAAGFRDATSRYCQALQTLGLPVATRIGILSRNRPEVLYLTAACLLNRYVMVPLHPIGSLDDHLYVIEDSEAGALLFDADSFSARAADIQARTTRLSHLLSLGAAAQATDLTSLAARFHPAPLTTPEISGEDVYRLSYSGGTTGRPKAIVNTHRMGLALLTIQLAEWEWPSDIRQLVCAPLSHAGAAMFLPTLLRGGSLLLFSAFDPVEVLQAIERHRITCVLLVPTMIYALLDHPRLGEFDLSSLETVFYGASLMSPTRLRQAIERFGPIFFQFYGQSEAPMSLSILRRADHRVDDPVRLASCGRPVPWVDVALLDDRNGRVPIGTPGEICARGPLVMGGYHNKPEQTAEALAGGWLHTGDVAVEDGDGFLRIVDRKKDMIVTGGFNVYPREIEDVLGAHPQVANCAVVGVPDAHWGEAVKAVVVLRPGAAPCAEELIALVRERKGPVQAPKTVNFVDAIPVTSLGKPDKKALRARYADQPRGETT